MKSCFRYNIACLVLSFSVSGLFMFKKKNSVDSFEMHCQSYFVTSPKITGSQACKERGGDGENYKSQVLLKAWTLALLLFVTFLRKNN